MSSMWRFVVIIPVLLATATSSSAQYAPVANATLASAPASRNVGASLELWRTLRQSSSYRFSDYAGFLIANPGWPDESRMRGWAEKALQPGENAPTVIAFFASGKPKTGSGWARLAEAFSASGRTSEALDAARAAWRAPDLGSDDEQAIWSRYGASFTRADADARVDSLLFAKKADSAARLLPTASPDRQPAFAARIAMQQDSPEADSRYQAVMGGVIRDAGLMMDRARWLRAHNYPVAATQLAARHHAFAIQPADPQRFLEMLILLAGDAVESRDWQTAFSIASQVDDVLPAGTSIADQPIDIRDDYTTLAWLAGTIALDRLNRPSSAIAMFDRYAQGGKSLQVQTKGNYWAGRAALGAGQFQQSNAYFERASAYPELFYGQLALERLGRAVTAPPTALPQYVTTSAQRMAFSNRSLVQAVRLLGQQGRSTEQALFVRALAESLDSDGDRNLAIELGQQLGRDDLPVWTSRMARVKGSAFYVSQAYPGCGLPFPASSGRSPTASAARKARLTPMR